MNIESLINTLKDSLKLDDIAIENKESFTIIRLLDTKYPSCIYLQQDSYTLELTLIELNYDIPQPLLISILTLKPYNARLSLNIEDEKIKVVAIIFIKELDINLIESLSKSIVSEFNNTLKILLDCSSIIQNFSNKPNSKEEDLEDELSKEIRDYL